MYSFIKQKTVFLCDLIIKTLKKVINFLFEKTFLYKKNFNVAIKKLKKTL